jgi:metal-sulfur cluster biosynthetic enzyme
MNATALDAEAVWQTLASILDPEFAISIVDLGLIYSVECVDGNVHVVMTLTTPTCPSGAWIHEGAQNALRQLSGVQNVQVDLVFEPSWNTEMLGANARRELGWSAESRL